MFRYFLFATLVAAMLLWLPLCAGAALTLTDDSGRTLHLAHVPQRIVALAPNITELLFAVGAGAQVVGADSFSDYPQQARRLPRIGDASRINFERIVALHPDLVVGWRGGNRSADLHAIRQLGLPLLLTDAHRLSDVARLLRLLGSASGHAGHGESAAREFERRLAALRARYAGAKPQRVFYQIWDRPLMTIGGKHWIDDALSLCGGRNIFADLDAASPVVSLEAVLARAPEVIVSASDAPDNRAMWQGFAQLPAVRRGAFIRLDADDLHRPTPRVLDGVAALCAALASDAHSAAASSLSDLK
jgi:iron complex transport system substrate-binding protein